MGDMTDRIREWWRLWWDEVLVIIGVSTVLCLLIWGGWYLFQTTPSPLAEGRVVGHSYTAQYEETHYNPPICIYNSSTKTTNCYPQPPTHHTHCVGGCFELRVDGCSNDRRGDSHCRKEWKDVGQYTYENCRTGQYWIRNKPECSLR